MAEVLYISLHASKVRNNILWMILDIDGTVASPALGNFIGKSLGGKNIFKDTLVVQATQNS